jgi:superfamily II DNA or RNA helicase
MSSARVSSCDIRCHGQHPLSNPARQWNARRSRSDGTDWPLERVREPDGTHELVAAPRLLDEGIDVPAADLAIILASSRSKRQMIQRMGRVVRLKQDGRMAPSAVLFVEGTRRGPDDACHTDKQRSGRSHSSVSSMSPPAEWPRAALAVCQLQEQQAWDCLPGFRSSDTWTPGRGRPRHPVPHRRRTT